MGGGGGGGGGGKEEMVVTGILDYLILHLISGNLTNNALIRRLVLWRLTRV